MQHEAFTSGNFDTHFVKKYFTPEVLDTNHNDEAIIAAIIMEQLLSQKKAVVASVQTAEISNWVKNRNSLR
jgi:acetyl/propionyl-CoA carboxylase alpha subunit